MVVGSNPTRRTFAVVGKLVKPAGCGPVILWVRDPPIAQIFYAKMMELVDMFDLKSNGDKSPCGFESHSWYSWRYRELVYRFVREANVIVGSSPTSATNNE